MKRNPRRGDRIKIKGGLYDWGCWNGEQRGFSADRRPAGGQIPNWLYHVAQMPGLFLLLIAIQRRSGRQPTWQPPPDL